MVVILAMSFKTVRLQGDQKFSASSALATDPALAAGLPNYTHRYVLNGYVNTEGVYMDWDSELLSSELSLENSRNDKLVTYPKLAALSRYAGSRKADPTELH